MPDLTGHHTGGIVPASISGPGACAPGVREVGSAIATFAAADDGSLVNMAPVAVVIGQAGETRRNVLSWAAHDRDHEPDAPLYVAPLSEPRHVEACGHILELAPGELRIPVTALV